ncbi:metadherin a isoform X2 [Syngnathoides biaculeatus]|uniref:metadherin a isoform X2 n=1 Tax=Syngnathoides biaculeatus TaxID=300417 RepID=UPI002ADD7B70|nr:metadherin a isoform X2 [Syngnathoides biaculeatus]
MAGGDWGRFALEEAELLSGRLKDLLSSGQAYVRSHLGLDLGLEPELYPTWLTLTTAAACAVFLLAALWVAVCGGRKRSPPAAAPGRVPVAKALVTKPVKPEVTKKRNAKKAAEKTQSNGQPAAAVVVPQQVKVPKVFAKLLLPITTRKAPEVQPPAGKKDKKKGDKSVKATQYVVTQEGKEPDEGTWETKVSNREKRQQRRKDKCPEIQSDPGKAHVAKGHAESPSNVKKKNRVANEPQQSGSATKGSSGQVGDGVARGGWNDFPSKISATQAASAETTQRGSRSRARAENRSSAQKAQGGAQTRVANVKSDLNPGPVSTMRMNAAAEPLSKSVEVQWMTPADDQWGGTNCAEPSSDWNAPAEPWGNYEDPPEVAMGPSTARKGRPLPNMVTGGEKDEEDPVEGGMNSKKKRKRKKKSQDDAMTRPQAGNSAPKPEDLPAAASKKPSVPSSSLKRPEQNAAATLAVAPETAKRDKKKGRREN